MNRETKSEGRVNGRAGYGHTLIGSFFELLVGGGLLNEIQDLVEHMYGQSISLLVFSGIYLRYVGREGKTKWCGWHSKPGKENAPGCSTQHQP